MSSGIAASGTVTATRWSAMLRHHRWWLTRIGVLPVHLTVFAVAAFFLVRLVPGDPVLTATGGQVTPEQYLQAR